MQKAVPDNRSASAGIFEKMCATFDYELSPAVWPMRNIISADKRSRILPPTRDTSARVQAKLSGRLASVISEIISCSSSIRGWPPVFGFGNLL